MASQFLRRAGYEVVEASSAEDALRWAERNPAGPDLLLTDVVMPGRSGGVLAQTLRRSRPTLRVLYMSGYTDDAIVRHGLSIGTAELVDKPFDSRTLLDRVATLLETAPAAAGAGEEAGSGAATPAPGP
jgi:DNA-binding response OmpR family regulator